MVGIPDEGTDNIALDKADAINLLLNRNDTPNQASEVIQESEDTTQEEVSVEEAESENVEEVVEVNSEATEEEAEDYRGHSLG